MSSLGNLTNIRTVIFEHKNRGLYNYDLGKKLLKTGNVRDFQTQKLVLDYLNQIVIAIKALDKFDNDEVAQMASANLKSKSNKLEKKLNNAQRNVEFLPKLEQILKETDFDKIGEKEAEEITDQVLKMSQYHTSSKITSLSLDILSNLSKFAKKEANNNNASIVIENPKEEDLGELLFDVPLHEEPLQMGDGSLEDLLLDDDFDQQPFVFIPPNNPQKEEIIVDNNNNMDMPHQQRPASLMEDINNALDLVLKATPDEFAKRLQHFSTEIEKFGKVLSQDGLINFEHALHGQIFDYYTGKGFETKDVEGVPFARSAMQTGFITQEELTQCCNNTKTIVYLDILRKLIEDVNLNEKQLNEYTNKIMQELEQHHAHTAWIVFGETSNFGTAEEKNLVEGDFGRNGFISDKVSRETKLKAVLKTIELRTAQIKKEYEQQ